MTALLLPQLQLQLQLQRAPRALSVTPSPAASCSNRLFNLHLSSHQNKIQPLSLVGSLPDRSPRLLLAVAVALRPFSSWATSAAGPATGRLCISETRIAVRLSMQCSLLFDEPGPFIASVSSVPVLTLLSLAVAISSLVITNPRKRSSINIIPNAFPATRISAHRPNGDSAPVEFVQVSSRSSVQLLAPYMIANYHQGSRDLCSHQRPQLSPQVEQ